MIWVIHIHHRDDDDREAVIGPFDTMEDAESALEASPSWERDDRYECGVWHAVGDWPCVAIPLEMTSPERRTVPENKDYDLGNKEIDVDVLIDALRHPEKYLSAEEIEEYERCQQSVIDARHSAERNEGQQVIG